VVHQYTQAELDQLWDLQLVKTTEKQDAQSDKELSELIYKY